jgi:hypothetical protein
MKPLFILLTVIASFFSKTSSANDDVVSNAVLKSFQSSFANAKEIDWSFNKSLYKARFTLDGLHIIAYYNSEGSLVAMTRNISSSQLPIALQTTIKKEYTAFWISDLFEIANEDGTSYYITLENAKTKLVLKSTNNAAWSKFQKDQKI